MAKTSGGIRSTRPSVRREAPSDWESEVLSNAEFESVVREIAKPDSGIDMKLWEKMDHDQRELALMSAGFSGLVSEDDFDGMATLYYAKDKSALLSRLEEDIVNENDPAYGMDDSTSWTVRYADGTTRSLSHGMENDYEIKLSSTGSYSANYRKARAAIQTSRIAWIIKSDGYGQPEYYVRDEAAMADLKKYGGFEEWKKGRGEKRRSYIQDDWV